MESGRRVNLPFGFGALLRRHRLAAGLSQQGLAERAGMSLYGISALERGHRKTPHFQTLTLLAGALALNEEERREFVAAAQRPLRSRGSVTVGPWTSLESANLPFALTRFIGREAELNEITALLGKHRFVTLIGAGGIGKTQTALRAATARSNVAEVCFVGLAPMNDPSLVPTRIATAFGVQEVPNHPLLETLVAFLKNKRMLLVLDNCEHVIQQAAVAAEALLSGCQHVQIIATSREPLRTAGERAYRLPSLAMNDASVLFADRAEAVNVRFELTNENAPIVSELCRRLDGIPLAIELAAARISALSLESVVSKLEDRFALLSRGERTALPRQQTMRATIDWSYDLLSPSEQRVFERLSAFAGAPTIEDAKSVCVGGGVSDGNLIDLLSSLVDKSLVVAELDASETRYRLLDSFREYGRERLAARGDQAVVAHRHARTCCEAVRGLPYHTHVLKWLDDCRLALQWSLTKRGDVVLGQELVGNLVTVWHSLPFEGQRWVAEANTIVDERTPSNVLASLKVAESTIAGQFYDLTTALDCAEQAITLYRSIRDLLGVARAQRLAATWLGKLGRLDESDVLLEEVLTTGRHVGDRLFIGSALQKIAENKAKRGHIDAARRYVREAMAAYDELGDKKRVAEALMDLGAFEGWTRDFESSVLSTKEALAIARSASDLLTIVICLNNMATSLLLLNRYDEAETCSREALVLAREQQLMFWAVAALGCIASISALRIAGFAEDEALARARVTARILGFADAYSERSGLKQQGMETEQHKREIAQLTKVIGFDELTRLVAEGAAMGEEQAFEEVLHLS